MEEFFPSEVARLVLGYLDELKCKKSFQFFMKESSNLQEYSMLYNEGKKYSTKVNGKSLLDILKEYCSFKKEAREPELKDHFNSKDVLDKVVQKCCYAVDHAFQQYLPSICRNNSGNSDDIQSIRPNEVNYKDNCNDSHKSINNKANISLNTSNEGVSFPSPQVIDVISLQGLNSRKEIILKQNLFNSIPEDEPVCLLENIKIEEIDEPMHLQETAKVEEIDEPMHLQEKVEDNIVEEPNIPNENISEPNATVQRKVSEAACNRSIERDCDTGGKSTIPFFDSSLSSIESSNELILNSVNNVDMENVIKLKKSFNRETQSHHSTEKGDIVFDNFNMPNISLRYDNNLEVNKNSSQCPVSQGVDVLNSSNNQFAYTMPSTNDSFSHQLFADSGLPIYHLPNFLSSSSNNYFLMHTTPNNNVPLVGTTNLPVNNASNYMITSVDSRSNNISFSMPIPTVVENRKSFSNTVAVNEKEPAKQMNKEVPSTIKKGVKAILSAVDKPPDQEAALQNKVNSKKKYRKKTPKLRVKKPRNTYSKFP